MLVAGCLLAFVVAQAPHTVHHIFESDTVNDHECAFNNAADRSSATAVDLVQLTAVHEFVGVAPLADPERVASHAFGPSSARAPPVRSS